MFEISEKIIETDCESMLTSKFAVFMIEFEYDNRVYVGHTIMKTVKSEVRSFVNSVLDESIKHGELLKQSMSKSKTLYLTIKEPEEYTLDSIFKLKYDLILSCGSYEPFGFNKICMIGNKYEAEKKYIRQILKEVGSLYKKTPLASNARSIKEYSFDANSREYKLVAEWPSITAAARHYNLNASNIAACCTGRLNTAYSRLWRYSD
jgi:hypothetical protein